MQTRALWWVSRYQKIFDILMILNLFLLSRAIVYSQMNLSKMEYDAVQPPPTVGCTVDNVHPKTGGQLNTQLFKKVYLVSSITMAFFTLPSWLGSVAFSQVIMIILMMTIFWHIIMIVTIIAIIGRIIPRTQFGGEYAWGCD